MRGKQQPAAYNAAAAQAGGASGLLAVGGAKAYNAAADVAMGEGDAAAEGKKEKTKDKADKKRKAGADEDGAQAAELPEHQNGAAEVRCVFCVRMSHRVCVSVCAKSVATTRACACACASPQRAAGITAGSHATAGRGQEEKEEEGQGGRRGEGEAFGVSG